MAFKVTDFSGNELKVGDVVMITAAIRPGLPYGAPIRFQARELTIVAIDHRPDTHAAERLFSNAKVILRDANRDGLTVPADVVLKVAS